jgi:hypothetical protein
MPENSSAASGLWQTHTTVPGLYVCPQCCWSFEVELGVLRTGPVVCSRHGRPPVRMELATDTDLWRCTSCARTFAVPPECAANGPVLCGCERNGNPAQRVLPRDRHALLTQLAAVRDRAETAAYLRLRENGYAAYAARWLARLEQGCVSLPPGADWCQAAIAEALGLPPGEAAGHLPEMARIPDRCPPPEPLPGTEAPAEGAMDADTAMRMDPEDYDDPERLFL